MYLESLIGSNETIVWKGKPHFTCFILESIFNPMLFFALIWAAFDFSFIVMANRDDAFKESGMGGFFILFFVFHLMPVWLYLGGVIFSVLRYKHTEYVITDKGIYISKGLFTFDYEMKPFTDLSHVNLHKGIFDQILGVGDIILECGHVSHTSSSNGHGSGHSTQLVDIHDPERIFKMVRDMQTDIYADTMYPNDLRPSENHGYNTTYRGRDRF